MCAASVAQHHWAMLALVLLPLLTAFSPLRKNSAEHSRRDRGKQGPGTRSKELLGARTKMTTEA